MNIKNFLFSIIFIFSLTYLTNAQFFSKLKGPIFNRNGKRRSLENALFGGERYFKIENQESFENSPVIDKLANIVVKRIQTKININK